MAEKVFLDHRRQESLKPGELRWIFVPTLTPAILNGKGQMILDVRSHRRHLQKLANPNSGISGIFLASNAGQGRDMDMKTLEQSIVTGIDAIREVNSKIPVVVGALRKTVDEVLKVVKIAEENGAQAIVLAPGYTEGNIYETLKTVSENTELPIILYNNPGFQNGKDLPMEFIREARENPRVVGIKDTSGKPEYFGEILRLKREGKFHVMQGDTKAGLSDSIRRADGMVPVEANLAPEVIYEILDRSQPFDKTVLHNLLENIKYLKNKNQIGTDGVIKRLLVENEIFTNHGSFPKVD